MTEWVNKDKEFIASVFGAKVKKRPNLAENYIEDVFDKLKSKGFPVIEHGRKGNSAS